MDRLVVRAERGQVHAHLPCHGSQVRLHPFTSPERHPGTRDHRGAETFETLGSVEVRCFPNCIDPDRITQWATWLVNIQNIITEFKPHRLALDSLSALERIGTVGAFREFVIGMTSFIKQQQITGLFTATTSSLMGGSSKSGGRGNTPGVLT